MNREVTVNLKVKDYTNRVLGVVKEKYGLKDKGDAMNKFAEMYGEEFVEHEVKEEVIREVIESCDRHIKKYGFRKMSIKELDKLCRGE
ncbi:DUF2683 family protein [Candidatus Micrarchaeota archaeon]|nr:DUF2683 family protein [Candidatus Micrarchaeota archaeon]